MGEVARDSLSHPQMTDDAGEEARAGVDLARVTQQVSASSFGCPDTVSESHVQNHSPALITGRS